jgi:hypothetical protein
MVGTGSGFTVTGYTVGVAAVQPFALVKLTLTVCAPAVFQVTVIVLLVVVPPAVIVPPAETVQRYPVLPDWVV